MKRTDSRAEGGGKERRRKREDERERETDTRSFAALKFKFSCVRVRVLTALSGKARYVRCLIRHALHLLILLGHTGLHFAERGGGTGGGSLKRPYLLFNILPPSLLCRGGILARFYSLSFVSCPSPSPSLPPPSFSPIFKRFLPPGRKRVFT